MIKPKSKGAGIMISDFVDEHQGFLALTDGEHQLAKQSDLEIKQYAREFLEYGESREGYWTRDKFIAQMERAIKIAEIKYPKHKGGGMFGCSIIAAATLLWVMMHLKSLT